MKPYMREATSRNPFVLVLNRGGKYIEVKRRFRTLDDAYDYGNIQMQSFFANGKLKADGYCVINWDEYKIEGYEGDFPTSGVFAKDLYANSPTFTTYTIYPNGVFAGTQNESKRRGNNMKLRTNESALQESYVSKLIAKMNIFGYNFVRSPYDTEILEFEDANGSVRQFYDWDEVEDFVSQLTSQKKRCRQNPMRYESKQSGNDMKLRINEWNSVDGDYIEVEELGKRGVIAEAKRLGATLISSTDSTTAYRLVDEGFQCICRSFDRYGNISAMVAGKHISSRVLPNDNEEYVYTNSSGAASTILGRA